MEIYYFLKAVLGSISKIFWIGRVEGKKNIPQKGAVILAPNHQSWLDFCFLATVVNRRLYFLVGEFVYKVKVAKFALERMGHIRVDRHAPDKGDVYAEAKKILSEGKALVVFPEGRMTRDGKIQKAYLGVAKMALASEVDIIPVVMETYHIYSVNHRRPLFGKRCKIKFLAPIKHQQIKEKTPAEIVHDLLMPEIAEALGESYDHRHLAIKNA
jgi:1-acyl-sn-glycerol-3-phosphate acyltransferase